jgi:hypothetical protein
MSRDDEPVIVFVAILAAGYSAVLLMMWMHWP